jgi:ABC-type Co2+ transport system permease subunit
LLVRKILPKNKSSISIAAAAGGLISVPIAAVGFVIQYALGATATFSVSTVLGAMVGTHILIGIGEAIITALTVSAVMASRSDLVFGWKNETSKLEIREQK